MSDGLDASPGISAKDRAERQRAIDFARGSMRYEGFILDAETETLFARYVAGEMGRPALNAAILHHCGIEVAASPEVNHV